MTKVTPIIQLVRPVAWFIEGKLIELGKIRITDTRPYVNIQFVGNRTIELRGFITDYRTDILRGSGYFHFKKYSKIRQLCSNRYGSLNIF